MQLAFLILRYCGHTKLNYVARTLPPDIATGLMKGFDQCILRALSLKTKIHAPSVAVNQLRLPLRLGGCGLRSYYHVINRVAFFSSVCATLPRIIAMKAKFFPHTDLFATRLFERLQDCFESIRQLGAGDPSVPKGYKQFPKEFKEAIELYGNDEKCASHLQHRLTKDIDYCKYKKQLSISEATAARLQSLTNPESSIWLQLIPDRPSFQIADWIFIAGLRHRLGLPPSIDLPRFCPCGKSLADDPSHHQGCVDLIPRAITSFRHHLVVRALQRIGQEHGWVVQVELNDEGKPDLRFTGTSVSIISDVAVVHPLASSHVKSAAKEPGITARASASHKTAKYRALAETERATFLPAIMETYGYWGPDFHTLLHMLCNGQSGRGNRDRDRLDSARKTLAITLQVGIARVYGAGHQYSLQPSIYDRQPRFARKDAPRYKPRKSRRRARSADAGP